MLHEYPSFLFSFLLSCLPFSFLPYIPPSFFLFFCLLFLSPFFLKLRFLCLSTLDVAFVKIPTHARTSNKVSVAILRILNYILSSICIFAFLALLLLSHSFLILSLLPFFFSSVLSSFLVSSLSYDSSVCRH